jgi:hypothetical protein
VGFISERHEAQAGCRLAASERRRGCSQRCRPEPLRGRRRADPARSAICGQVTGGRALMARPGKSALIASLRPASSNRLFGRPFRCGMPGVPRAAGARRGARGEGLASFLGEIADSFGVCSRPVPMVDRHSTEAGASLSDWLTIRIEGDADGAFRLASERGSPGESKMTIRRGFVHGRCQWWSAEGPARTRGFAIG